LAMVRDYSGCFDLRLTIERGFEIGGINLQPRGSDDRLLTPTTKIDASLWTKLADVARMNPTLLVGDRSAVAVPISVRDVFTANEDLAIVAQLHFLSRDGFANRAVPHAKRMRKTRERRSLGHAVPLNDCVPEMTPERFCFAFQSCTAGDESPKAPPELP